MFTEVLPSLKTRQKVYKYHNRFVLLLDLITYFLRKMLHQNFRPELLLIYYHWTKPTHPILFSKFAGRLGLVWCIWVLKISEKFWKKQPTYRKLGIGIYPQLPHLYICKIAISFDRNDVFWRNFFDFGQIRIFDHAFTFWQKLWFPTKIFDFWPKLCFLTTIMIFDQTFDFWPKSWFLTF